MRQEPRSIDFAELVRNAAAIFDEMERRHGGVIVRRAGKRYSLRPRATRGRKREPFSESDSLFQLAGKGASAEPTDIRHHKDEYVADAAIGGDPRRARCSWIAPRSSYVRSTLHLAAARCGGWVLSSFRAA